jgi:hypothetical protein
VAEPFRRQPAELLYMGSTPIPSSTTEPIDFLNYLRQNIRTCTAETYVKRLQRLSKIGNLDSPEQIKGLICTYPPTESYKELLTKKSRVLTKDHARIHMSKTLLRLAILQFLRSKGLERTVIDLFSK